MTAHVSTSISRLAPSIVVGLLTLAACAPRESVPAAADEDDDGSQMTADTTTSPRAALAVLRPVGNGDVTGQVRFAESSDGITYTARASGLAEGAHAYHVHESGDCTADDAGSAGPHWPLTASAAGDDPGFITGNLGELDADEDGVATGTGLLPGDPLRGARSIVGRAVVVHRRPNDPSVTPGGDAGARVACGVIGLTSAE